jgi:hypothetical protein
LYIFVVLILYILFLYGMSHERVRASEHGLDIISQGLLIVRGFFSVCWYILCRISIEDCCVAVRVMHVCMFELQRGVLKVVLFSDR